MTWKQRSLLPPILLRLAPAGAESAALSAALEVTQARHGMCDSPKTD
jgi:hypothetical protein